MSMPTTEQEKDDLLHFRYLPSVFRNEVTQVSENIEDGTITYKKSELSSFIQLDRINQRMDELNNLNWADLTWRDDMADFILYSSELHDRVDARKAELESQKNQLTGGKDE